jgi:uncharacterized membrane protein
MGTREVLWRAKIGRVRETARPTRPSPGATPRTSARRRPRASEVRRSTRALERAASLLTPRATATPRSTPRLEARARPRPWSSATRPRARPPDEAEPDEAEPHEAEPASQGGGAKGALARLRERLERGAQATDDAVRRLAQNGVELFVLPVFVGAMAGGGAWMWKHPDRLSLLDGNKLPQPERLSMLKWCAVGVALVVLANVLAIVARRLATGAFDALRSVQKTQRVLAFAAALPFAAVLKVPKLETAWPKLSMLYILAAGALVAVSAYQLPALDREPYDPEDDEESPPGLLTRAARLAVRHGPFLAVLGLWLGYGLLFSKLAITNHHSLNTRTTDLGYYDNIFFQSIHGKPLGCTFIKGEWHGTAHFDPILVLLSPLYLIKQQAETILTLQSFWLGAGVVPIYLLARVKKLGRLTSLALAACYVVYPALHGVNMYEFHSLALINPLVLWLVYCFEAGGGAKYWITLIALLLVREDIPLLVTFVGLYQILSGKAHGPRTGRRTIMIALLYFVVVKAKVMANGVLGSGKEGYSFAYYYEELIPDKANGRELVVSLLTNPTFALKLAFEEAKLLFLLQLFVPLALVPLFVKRARLMMVYGLAFCLLASRDAVFTIHFQYASILIPVLFALTALGLGELRDRGTLPWGLEGPRLVRGLAGGMLVMGLLSGWRFGAPLENEAFRGGFQRISRTMTPEAEHRYLWVKNTASRIPKEASLGVSDKLGPHASNRKLAYFYLDKPTDFVFIDEGELRGAKADKHKKSVAAGDLKEISRYGKMALFKWKRSKFEALPEVPGTPTAPLAPEPARAPTTKPPKVDGKRKPTMRPPPTDPDDDTFDPELDGPDERPVP